MQSQRDYVLRTVEERSIRFVQLWFTDVLGTPKGFNITSTELADALDEGMTFDGSAIDGFSRVQESDAALARRRLVGGPRLLRHRAARRHPVQR
jgi:glutamine synthetase